MKNVKTFLSQIVVLLVLIGLYGCKTDEPANRSNFTPTNSQRDYCVVTYTNTTSKYCAIIYIDGVALEGKGGGAWTLAAGKSQEARMYNLKFPKDIKIELHEQTDNGQYYTKVYATFEKNGCSFEPEYDYKVTIRENSATINHVLAE